MRACSGQGAAYDPRSTSAKLRVEGLLDRGLQSCDQMMYSRPPSHDALAHIPGYLNSSQHTWDGWLGLGLDLYRSNSTIATEVVCDVLPTQRPLDCATINKRVSVFEAQS
jgi:hypothetical protein